MTKVDTTILFYEWTNLILWKIHSKCNKKFSETGTIKLQVIVIDNIFVMFGGCCFQQTAGNRVWGTNCSSRRLAPLWNKLYAGKKLTEANPSLWFHIHYIDDVLSRNKSKYGNYVDRIYPINLEIDRDSLLSCIVLHIDIDREGRLRARLYDKRDDFNFSIVWTFHLYETVF